MDNKEFHKRLKENKWFDDPKKLIDYRLPCLKYYLDNDINMGVNGVNLKGLIQIVYKEEDFTLVNEAFLSLRKKYGYDK